MRIGTVVLIVAACMLGFYALNSFTASTASSNMQAIENQVADDQVTQYKIAERDGTSMEVCVHAQMVAAAYLQAKDEANYTQWEAIQKDDCKYANAEFEGNPIEMCETDRGSSEERCKELVKRGRIPPR